MGRLTQLVLECADAERLARFWQEVLVLPDPEGDADWMTLRWEPVGRFSFHRVADYQPPAWPGSHGEQQAHFDLLVNDLHEAGLAVESVGARPLSDVRTCLWPRHPWVAGSGAGSWSFGWRIRLAG